MYLSLLRLNPSSQAVQHDLRDVQALHRRVMTAFPDVVDLQGDARAFFGVLYRLETPRASGSPHLYVQSRVEPNWERLPKGYLQPSDGLPNPAVKWVGDAYDKIRAGRVLRFRLRANPTKKIDTKSAPDGARRNGRRVPLRGVDDQIAWLSRKAEEGGFELLQATVAASGSAELVRSYSTGKTFQGVLFEGRLRVTDSARFREVLASGIGPGKAYGFGLLSVGPG